MKNNIEFVEEDVSLFLTYFQLFIKQLKKNDVPTQWHRLIKDLSKTSICGFIQCSANDLVQIIELLYAEKIFEDMLGDIRETCSTIYNFLLHSSVDEVKYLVPLLTSTLNLLSYAEHHLPCALPEVSSAPQDLSACFLTFQLSDNTGVARWIVGRMPTDVETH